MPDIFLSYSRDDLATARRFAEAFEHEGFSVWWDQTLDPGEHYDHVTEKALREAKAVVVLWSTKSVESRWVRAEATLGDRNRTLVPVMIEPCERPIMFELTQTADLSHWDGDRDDTAWQSYLSVVRKFIEKGAPNPVPRLASTKPVAKVPARNLWVIAALIAVALLWSIFWATRPDDSPEAAPAAATTAVSLAVLPFVDMSTAKDQESFSDGLSEEILNQLAQIKDLAVTGRTSSFSFKGKNEDLRVIAEKLGVANLLEGSIRKEGNQLRITAQLINGGTGAHLWSKTYARERKDVFAVQEEIAKDVAQALSIKLDVGDVKRAEGGTTNVEAYEAYLAGLALPYDYQVATTNRSIDLLQLAVSLDPDFALAWLRLSDAHAFHAILSGQEYPKEALAALEQVGRLAPTLPAYQLARASLELERFAWDDVSGLIESARVAARGNALATADVDTFESVFLKLVGRPGDAVAASQRVKRTHPQNALVAEALADAHFAAGDKEAAISELERGMLLPNGQALRGTAFGFAASSRDRPQMDKWFDSAIDQDASSLRVTAAMKPLLDRPAEALAKLRQLSATTSDVVDLVRITIWAAYFQDPEFALEQLSRLESFSFGRGRALPNTIWNPLMRDVRQLPAFKEVVRKIGLVDYWRNSGTWGEFCKPVGTDDFECQ